ncbi:hypothetical protein H9L25_00485 [Terrisporobacter mayombei]|nr:hypothetical protein [Terrisporobacter mayombei]
METFVIGTLLSDLSLYIDYKLKESDFIIEKCKFFFSLGRIASKKYSELDELSVNELIKNNRELKSKYNDYGGWETIQKILSFSNKNNIASYVDELYKNNFLIKRGKKEIFTKTIETDGIEVNPFKELFPSMSCKEVEEYFLGDLSKDAVATINNNVKGESLIIRKDDREKLKEGISMGTPYDIIFEYTEKEIGKSDDETPKYIYACPFLSQTTNGLGSGGGNTQIAGYGGIGKSTYVFFNLILPMVYRNEVSVIYSNEQKVIYFRAMLYSFIASNIFGYYKLTRNKIENGTFTDEEEELMDKITDFLDRRNFEEMLTFYSLEEFDVDEILRISRGLISHQGATVFLIDTFKSEDSSDQNYVGAMVEATKRIDTFGNKHNVKMILTLQLTPGNEGQKSYLTASDLAECKSTKNVADILFLMRKVVPELELDKNNKKFYLRPYKLKKSGRSKVHDSSWRKEEIEFTEKDLEGDYRLIFLNKNRRGKSDVVMLLKFNGVTGRFEEVGICQRVHRGSLGYN